MIWAKRRKCASRIRQKENAQIDPPHQAWHAINAALAESEPSHSPLFKPHALLAK
jgi:hypothetical protein